MAGFPADLRELLESCDLQHRHACFGAAPTNVVDLALELAASGPSALLQHLGDLGFKIGERQRLVGFLTRSTRALQMAAASLLSPSLEQRLGALAGPNLLPLVATFPRSEAAAVDGRGVHLSSITFGGSSPPMFQAISEKEDIVQTCMTAERVRMCISTTAWCAVVVTRERAHGVTGAYSAMSIPRKLCLVVCDELVHSSSRTTERSFVAKNTLALRCMAPRIVHRQNDRIVAAVIGI